MSKIYDEELELNSYIFDNYSQFLTATESLAYKTMLTHEKAESTDSPNMKKMLLERWAHDNDEDVRLLLADGPHKFRNLVRKRILKEHVGDVFVNRCSECDKVVSTPLAKQCLWCGNDWHKS
jgi:hypothetical protein